MTLYLNPDRNAFVRGRLEAVAASAADALKAEGLAEAKRALNAAWFAIHDAQNAINEAERQTREEAINRIGVAA